MNDPYSKTEQIQFIINSMRCFSLVSALFRFMHRLKLIAMTTVKQ